VLMFPMYSIIHAKEKSKEVSEDCTHFFTFINKNMQISNRDFVRIHS